MSRIKSFMLEKLYKDKLDNICIFDNEKELAYEEMSNEKKIDTLLGEIIDCVYHLKGRHLLTIDNVEDCVKEVENILDNLKRILESERYE